MADGTLKKFANFVGGSDEGDSPPQLFQHRITRTPGIVSAPSTSGAGAEFRQESPANLIPQDSDPAMLKLRNEWAARARQNPQEGYLTVDPRHQFNSAVINHEAAHSVYNQAIPYASLQDQHLQAVAQSNGMYMPAPGVPGYDPNSGREAGAYAVGHSTGQESDPRAAQAFMREIVKSARSPEERAAANQLFNLYLRNSGN